MTSENKRSSRFSIGRIALALLIFFVAAGTLFVFLWILPEVRYWHVTSQRRVVYHAGLLSDEIVRFHEMHGRYPRSRSEIEGLQAGGEPLVDTIQLLAREGIGVHLTAIGFPETQETKREVVLRLYGEQARIEFYPDGKIGMSRLLIPDEPLESVGDRVVPLSDNE